MRVVMVYPNKAQQEKRFVSFHMFVDNKFIDMKYSKENEIDKIINDKIVRKDKDADNKANNKINNKQQFNFKEDHNQIKYVNGNGINLMKDVSTFVKSDKNNAKYDSFDIIGNHDINKNSKSTVKSNNLNQNEIIRYNSTNQVSKITAAKSQRKKKLVFVKTLPLDENTTDKNQFINNRMIDNLTLISNSNKIPSNPNILQTKEQFLISTDMRNRAKNNIISTNRSYSTNSINGNNNRIKNKNFNNSIENNRINSIKYTNSKNDLSDAANKNIIVSHISNKYEVNDDNFNKTNIFYNGNFTTNHNKINGNYNGKTKNDLKIDLLPKNSKEFTTFTFKINDNKK